jgi:lipopolysaccharide transport system permease protein
VSAIVPQRRRNALEPPARWSALELTELWRYRELLYLLAWRDVKVRYKQAALGVVWAVLQPLLMMGIFTLVFSRIANVSSDGVPYPVFVFAGLVPWTMYSSGLSSGSFSLVENTALVSKVYFPKLVIPAAAILAWLPDFALGSCVFFLVMAIYGVAPEPTAFLLPLVAVAVILAAASVGVWLSALNVAYRDVRYVVPFFIQLSLFVTPVAYPTASIPQGFAWLAGLNPMTWVIDFSRWALLATPFTVYVNVFSMITTGVLLVTGLVYFRRVQHYFADVI